MKCRDLTGLFDDSPSELAKDIRDRFNYELGLAMLQDVYLQLAQQHLDRKKELSAQENADPDELKALRSDKAILNKWNKERKPRLHNAIEAIAKADFEFSDLPSWRYCYLAAGAATVTHFLDQLGAKYKPDVTDVLLTYLALRSNYIRTIADEGQEQAIECLKWMFAQAATRVNEASPAPPIAAAHGDPKNSDETIARTVDPKKFRNKTDSEIQAILAHCIEPWLVVESCTSFSLKLVSELIEEHRNGDQAETVGSGVTPNSGRRKNARRSAELP